MFITRLAPSPTGALHLGNARTFLVNFLLARQNNWRILCRIDDIDGPRLKPAADRQALQDLQWLGISWDTGPVYQSQRLPVYRAAAQWLLSAGHAYPCVCSRSEVASAASAPHASDGASVYPGTCRGRFPQRDAARQATGKPAALRFAFDPPGRDWHFVDGFKGHVRINDATLGDFPIEKADATPAYQLACAVDDLLDGITHVVRADDLLDSTPRQLALMARLRNAPLLPLLPISPASLIPPLIPSAAQQPTSTPPAPGRSARPVGPPTYFHLPLITGPDGRRLAKRHGDTRLLAFRQAGLPPSDVLRLLATWLGIIPPARLQSAEDLIGRFDLARLSPDPIAYQGELDHPATAD